ncbi:MAG: metal-dependent hydrolase [Gemmatimonadota bacterium]|nr:metal-dependent hydrolase [Gemmatimonadota bacterium]
MYIGHVGAALGAKRVRRSIGLLVLLIATYTPDWVDTGLCIAGAFSPREILSHSIPAIALFAALAFAVYATSTRDWRGALIVAAVIVSHMLLDWITGYKPTWPGGPMIGLQLYDHPIADFIAEAVVIVIGALLYARTLPPRKRPWMDVSVILGALLLLQLAVDTARMLMTSLPKC